MKEKDLAQFAKNTNPNLEIPLPPRMHEKYTSKQELKI